RGAGGAALGGGRLARLGATRYAHYVLCVAPAIAETYRPDPAATGLLGERLERYRRLYRALKAEFAG
ncbi:xylulokinase, partial [Burkholderia pseudomallei]|nr:xylulokinase [Burkholderia pseudomallei]